MKRIQPTHPELGSAGNPELQERKFPSGVGPGVVGEALTLELLEEVERLRTRFKVLATTKSRARRAAGTGVP